MNIFYTNDSENTDQKANPICVAASLLDMTFQHLKNQNHKHEIQCFHFQMDLFLAL